MGRRRGVRCAAGVLLAGLAAACGRDGERCRWPAMADTAGWTLVDAGAFVFKAPPGMREEIAAGAIGYMGLWSASDGNRALAFDYGQMAPDPRGRGTGGEESWACETPLAGYRAVVRVGVRALESRQGAPQRHATAEAWWEAAGADSARLLLVGWGAEADSALIAREALTAARTVRFRTRWTAVDSLRQLHRFCRTLRAQADAREEYRPAWEEWRTQCPAGDPPPPPDYEDVQ